MRTKKQAATKIPTSARVQRSVTSEKDKGIEILNAALEERKPDLSNVPVSNSNEVISNDDMGSNVNVTDQTSEVKESVNESVIEPNEEGNNIAQEKPKSNELSIWGDLNKATEEDANIGNNSAPIDEPSSIEDLASQASEGFDEDEANARKQGNIVKASIVVEIADVIFMVLCILLTWDFSSENQKKYTLEKDRKKAIQTNLFKLYQLDNKKPNPKKDIWFLILGSYAPMLIVAVLVMIKNLKAKQEAKKRQKVLNQMEIDNAKVIENLKAEKYNLELRNNALNEEIKYRNEKPKALKSTTSTPFKGVPKIGKQKIIPELSVGVRGTGKSTRGVKSGVKRGPYKKK